MSLSRAASATQHALIARLLVAGATKGQIAEHAGVDATMISKWIADSGDRREMTFDAVRRLADVYGWDVVVGPLAAAAGWQFSRLDAEATPDARGTSIELVSASAELAATVNRALADGRLDEDERRSILHQLRESQRLIEALLARVTCRS
jgi:hypothetical protein